MGDLQAHSSLLWRCSTFLHENELAPAYLSKILTILGDPQKSALLQVELAVVVDTGEQLVKANYTLEGDGLLGYTCLRFSLV